MSSTTQANPSVEAAKPPAARFLRPELIWYGLLLGLCFWPTMSELCRLWMTDDDMVHGLFAPFVAAYAMWHDRERLLASPVRPRPILGGLVVLAGIVLCVLGTISASVFFPRMALLVQIAGLVLAVRGWPTLKRLRFPFALLVFAVPLPSQLYKPLTLELQLLASRLADGLLDMLGYSVFREGNILNLPGQRLEVAQACNGIRSLFTVTFFTLTYAYLAEGRSRVRIFLLAWVVPLALFSNAARILITAIAGQRNEELARGVYHVMTGWATASLGLILVILIHRIVSAVYPPGRPDAP